MASDYDLCQRHGRMRCTECLTHPRLSIVIPPHTHHLLLDEKDCVACKILHDAMSFGIKSESVPGVSNNPDFLPKIKAAYSALIQEMNRGMKKAAEVDHPDHYGGAENPYEAIKVIDAWNLGFCLGNTIKYIARAGKKSPDALTDLKKALWYLQHEIATREGNTNHE